MNLKEITTIVLMFVLVVLVGGIGLILNKEKSVGASPSWQNINTIASTTSYTITTTSVRIMGTSTAYSTSRQRVAARINVRACSTMPSVIHLNVNGDTAATATGNGPVLTSTSTMQLDTDSLPVKNDAYQAIASAGTCTVDVTEWLRI